MKITVGDLIFEDALVCKTPNSWDYPLGWRIYREQQEELSARVAHFLAVARECYIARHGQEPPQRSTVDEF